MINSKNFYDIASSNPKQIKSKFDQLLSLKKSFSKIETFPAYKGIYFLYLTSNESLLYVGAAYKGKRTIKNRCRQYLQDGEGGYSFRGKVERLKNITCANAIEFIKANVSAKFINLSKFDKDTIKQIEQLLIWAYQPPLNFILKKFNFEQFKIVIE